MEIFRDDLSDAQEAFSLLELIVVISIFSLMVAIGVPSYQMVRNNVMLTNQAQEVVSYLRLAQNRAISARDASNHGVYFESNKLTIYDGADWASMVASHEYPYSNGIRLCPASVCSPIDVSFQRLKGTAIVTANGLPLTPPNIAVGYPSAQKSISVAANGTITVQ